MCLETALAAQAAAMLLSEQHTGVGPSASIFGSGNSNDAKIRLLERRLRGDTPSPRHIDRAQSTGEVCLPQPTICLRSLYLAFALQSQREHIVKDKLLQQLAIVATAQVRLAGCVW